jgi:hypothetical protein
VGTGSPLREVLEKGCNCWLFWQSCWLPWSDFRQCLMKRKHVLCLHWPGASHIRRAASHSWVWLMLVTKCWASKSRLGTQCLCSPTARELEWL